MSRRSVIGQQVYTRGREGIFRTNEGLDTAAKSPSLDPAFIKRTLHPFCGYQAPQELLQQGEEELSRYPEAFIVFHADSGELVIGRGKFAGTDFTGQRDNIIIHHYVVPKDRKEEFVLRPELLFRTGGFLDRYDAHAQGKALPDLEEPVLVAGEPPDPRGLLARLGIDRERFKQLLWAVMMSVSSNKKVYAALDVPVSESSRYAKQLMELVYLCLPYGMRRQLGFITYNHEPQGKKYLNVMFVEKGSIRPDRMLDKEYIFDFPNGRFLNVELKGADYYLDFVWESLDRPERLQAFYEFAQEGLKEMGPAAALSVAAYYQLAVLFMVEEGQAEWYQANKEGVITAVLEFLAAGGPELKPRLDALFWDLTERETAAFSQSYLEAVLGYARINSLSGRLIKAVIGPANLRELASGGGNVEGYLEAVLQYPELFRVVTQSLLNHRTYAQIVEHYALERLSRVQNMAGLQQELGFWSRQQDKLLDSRRFQEETADKVWAILGQSRQRIEEGKVFHDFAGKLSEADGVHGNLVRFCQHLQQEAAAAIIEAVEPEELDSSQFEGLTYIIGGSQEALAGHLAGSARQKLTTLQDAWLILHHPLASWLSGHKETDIRSVYLSFSEQDPQERLAIQKLLRKFLRLRGETDYEKAALAFFDGADYAKPQPARSVKGKGANTGGSWNGLRFSYRELLQYVEQAPGGGEQFYLFLQWASAYPPFLNRSGGMEGPLVQAVKEHFRRFRSKELKSRRACKKRQRYANASLRQLYDQIWLEQAGLISRLLARPAFLIWAGILLCLAVSIWIVIAVNSGGSRDNPPSGSDITPAPTFPAASATPDPAASGSPAATQDPSEAPGDPDDSASPTPGETGASTSPTPGEAGGPASGGAGASASPTPGEAAGSGASPGGSAPAAQPLQQLPAEVF